MARFGSRGALPVALAAAAVAACGGVAYALWPGAGPGGPSLSAGSPPPSTGTAPVGPLALTPPTGAEAPRVVTTGPASPPSGSTSTAAPTTAPPTTAAPAPPATAAPKEASPACVTLSTSSAAVLGAGCYVETSLTHPDLAWPSGTSTSSEAITRGEVWDGLTVGGSVTGTGITAEVTLANHSTQTMLFPGGLVIHATLVGAGVPTVAVDLADGSVTSLAPGRSVTLTGPVNLTVPGTYALGAAVEFTIA